MTNVIRGGRLEKGARRIPVEQNVAGSAVVGQTMYLGIADAQ